MSAPAAAQPTRWRKARVAITLLGTIGVAVISAPVLLVLLLTDLGRGR